MLVKCSVALLNVTVNKYKNAWQELTHCSTSPALPLLVESFACMAIVTMKLGVCSPVIVKAGGGKKGLLPFSRRDALRNLSGKRLLYWYVDFPARWSRAFLLVGNSKRLLLLQYVTGTVASLTLKLFYPFSRDGYRILN